MVTIVTDSLELQLVFHWPRFFCPYFPPGPLHRGSETTWGIYPSVLRRISRALQRDCAGSGVTPSSAEELISIRANDRYFC